MTNYARKILRLAREVGVMLWSQVVDAQDGLVLADLRDGNAADRLARGPRDQLLVLPVPPQRHGQVPVRHRAQHRHSLAQFQVFSHRKFVDCRGHFLCENVLFLYLNYVIVLIN